MIDYIVFGALARIILACIIILMLWTTRNIP
jgi:hypothetical protein